MVIKTLSIVFFKKIKYIHIVSHSKSTATIKSIQLYNLVVLCKRRSNGLKAKTRLSYFWYENENHIWTIQTFLWGFQITEKCPPNIFSESHSLIPYTSESLNFMIKMEFTWEVLIIVNFFIKLFAHKVLELSLYHSHSWTSVQPVKRFRAVLFMSESSCSQLCYILMEASSSDSWEVGRFGLPLGYGRCPHTTLQEKNVFLLSNTDLVCDRPSAIGGQQVGGDHRELNSTFVT